MEIPWDEFCRLIGRPDLENDARFSTDEIRAEHNAALIEELDRTFVKKTRDEWEALFREANVIFGRIQTPTEVTADPQALANGFFGEIDFGESGRLATVNTPVNFYQNPASIKGPAPELGQHTEEIMLGLGYNWDDIARFKAEGAIL